MANIYYLTSHGALVEKNLPITAGDTRDSGLIPGSRRFSGRGNGNAYHSSCLERPMDRGAWWATVYVVRECLTGQWATKHTQWPWSSISFLFSYVFPRWLGFPVAQTIQNPPAVQETWVRSLGLEDPLEKEMGMTTHFSTLAWRSPWTQEPAGLQSVGLQRVGHNSVLTNTFFFFSPTWLRALNIFHGYIGYFHIFHKEMTIQIICLYFNWVIGLFIIILCFYIF